MKAVRTGFVLTAVAFAILGAACQRSGSASDRDLKLLGAALSDPSKYPAAVSELASRPRAAQAALREQSATAGTRKAFVLRLIDDHVKRADDYQRWAEAKPEALDSGAQSYFWAERLLFGDAVQGEAAASHLAKACCDGASEALALRIGDTMRDVDAGFGIAATAVAKAGDAQALQTALEAWYGVDGQVRSNIAALDTLRAAGNSLPTGDHRDIEQALLASLETDSLGRAARQARLALLWVVVDPGSLERVAALRKSEWGTDLRRDIDPVLAKAFVNSHRIGALK
jgi:hypothetical protein